MWKDAWLLGVTISTEEGIKLLRFSVIGCAVSAPLSDANSTSDGLPVGKRAWNN